MEPFTFGIVSIGVAGGSLFVVSILDYYGIKVNQTAINIALEMTKYGGILYLLKEMARVFT